MSAPCAPLEVFLSLGRHGVLSLGRAAEVLVIRPVVPAGRQLATLIAGLFDLVPGSGSLLGGRCIATSSLASRCRLVEQARHALHGLRG